MSLHLNRDKCREGAGDHAAKSIAPLLTIGVLKCIFFFR